MQRKEKWEIIIIDGEETKYSVSNHGRIVNNKTGYVLLPSPNEKGYLYVKLYLKNRIKMCRVHRLVAKYFVDGYRKGLEVHHKNNNKKYNFYKNLKWVTHIENMKDAREDNLISRRYGEENPTSKITNIIAEKICLLIQKGEKDKNISFELDIPHHIIYDIRRKRTWNFISDKYVFPKIKKRKRGVKSSTTIERDEVYIDLEDNCYLPEVKLIFIAS